MAVQKRKYDVAFKREALRLLEISGKSVGQIEEELGSPGLVEQVGGALSAGTNYGKSEAKRKS